MFFGALVLLVLQFFLSTHAFARIFITSILLLALWGLVYSWHHSRTHVSNAE